MPPISARSAATCPLSACAPAGRERDPRGAPAAMDALAALDVVDLLERGDVLGQHGVADVERVADRGELGLGDRGQHGHQLQARGGDDVVVELGHQESSSRSTRPATATTASSASQPTDSPRPWTSGSRAVGAHPPAAAERVGGAARDRPQRDERPPAVVRRPDRRPERDGVRQRGRRPGAEHDATGEAAEPDAVAPPEPRELHARDGAEDREPGATATGPRPRGRRAVVAICVATATPIDVKNQEGVAMAWARPAREASASASAAEASAAVGRWGYFPCWKAYTRAFPIGKYDRASPRIPQRRGGRSGARGRSRTAPRRPLSCPG